MDLELLKSKGLDDESLKAKLSVDPLTVEEGKIKQLINRIRSRIREGQARNFSEFRTFYALDVAWDTPFRQISPTLLGQFLDQDPNTEEVYNAVQQWGLTSLIQENPDPKNPGKTIKSFNFPVFFNVFVPLVKSYVTIRWAKIINDRRLTPFFKFDPVKMTTELGLKCEVITDRIQIMSNQYGYFDVTKQAVLKMLHYGMCLQFPKESWHSEEQWKKADDLDVAVGKKDESGEPVKVDDLIKVTSREGIRYHHPHPTRMYRDLAHGAYTFNYDSGCEFAGYWRITRYSDIQNGKYWNKDKIGLGATDFITGNSLFFNTVYSACTLKLGIVPPTPSQQSGLGMASAVGVGVTTTDREKELVNNYYGTTHGDQGVMVTEHFEKLIPKDNGLGDYDCPVWFRFVLAGDACTILYAEPLPYNPIIYYGYDADESRSRNASMSLEILPFQDQFSNVLTQILLTAKQNLANITFVDEAQLTETAIGKIKNIGESFFRHLNVFGYDSKKAARLQNRIAEAVQTANLPKGDVNQLIQVLKSILDILERVLVMSSNEVGQAASHEQTREEIRNIASSTSSRLIFTSIPVDIARDAWKRQLYDGLMAYGDDDIYIHLPSDIPLTKDILQQMGFTYVDKDQPADKSKYRRASIKKSNTAIPLWELASTRDGDDRTNDKQTAQIMATLVDKLLTNPITAQAIGAAQAIDLATKIGQLAGLPRDFKLRDMTPESSPEQQQAAAQDQLKQVVQVVLAQVNEELKPVIAPIAKEVQDHSQELALLFKALQLNPPNPANDTGQPEAPAGAGSQGNPGMAQQP